MKKLSLSVLLLASVALTAATINLGALFNYADQGTPAYITKDNTPATNAISNKGATLGRVLFYDKSLSLNGTVTCGSCHRQEFAFGDTAALSAGFAGGNTGRHSMRLVNARFGTESRFFWNERATSLEVQTTGPIKDHVEMGFSGMNGQPGIDSLIRRLEAKPHYQQLFTWVYGSPDITEEKLQHNLAQFVRSIQSFDSKYDVGRAQVATDAQPFPNFTAAENAGKALFLNPPTAGGAGCQGCHRAPEFDIDFALRNNGVVGVAGDPNAVDLTNTRSPTLRDLVNPTGQLNGPLMHDGSFTSLAQVVNHYNQIPNNPANTNLDHRLTGPGGQPQNLQLTQTQKDNLVAFLHTLTGSQVYTATQWSDPFDSQGNLDLIPLLSVATAKPETPLELYPNPASNQVTVELAPGTYQLGLYDARGASVLARKATTTETLAISALPAGTYVLKVQNLATRQVQTRKLIKR